MTCLECTSKDFCDNCPSIVSISAPTVVNVNTDFKIKVRIKSNAILFSDYIDVCLYEGGTSGPRQSTGSINLGVGKSVEVTFTERATADVGRLFYNISVVEQALINACADFGTFEVQVTALPKKYKCTNGVCVEDPNGNYNEPTCGGICEAPTRKYKCIDGYCTLDDSGTFTEATCGGTCLAQRKYKCTDAGDCVLDEHGPFTDSNCYGGCLPVIQGHNECRNNTCEFVTGAGRAECSPTGTKCTMAKDCLIKDPITNTCIIANPNVDITMLIYVGIAIVIVIVLILVMKR